VRDPASEKAKPLAAAGANVKLFSFDLGNKETFANIPKNPTAVFVNTPGHADRTALGIAGVEAAKLAGVCSVLMFNPLLTSVAGRPRCSRVCQHR
jgi:hypothetical protein